MYLSSFMNVKASYNLQREEFKNRLLKISIPIFPNIQRTAKAFLNLYEFQRKHC